MTERDLVCGVDIGGTRTKIGIVDLAGGEVVASRVTDTVRDDERGFLDGIAATVTELADVAGAPRGAGVSIGSYVFADGSIDGMSSFVPFLTHGYPLGGRLAEALGMPVRVDNDARLIGLAEARWGEGRGRRRVLTLTLGTGVGVGLCEDGRPVGADSHIHLAGHVKVRDAGGVRGLDDEPCYCGIPGCFESTCSGTSLAKVVRARLGGDATNERLFELAAAGDDAASGIVDWYIDMLATALNQYVYLFCPDAIVLGGGVARGLEPYADRVRARLTAEVWEGQRTEVLLSRMREDSGIVGAASLLAR